MTTMTRRERMTAIHTGQIPDRPAVKLWGCEPARAIRHPAYAPVKELGLALTDIAATARSPFSLYAGARSAEFTESFRRHTPSPEWDEAVHILHTPEGDLEEVVYVSTCGRPGYHRSYFLKEPRDIRRLLSLPYEGYALDTGEFRKLQAEIGDGGIVMFGLDHAMYGLQRMIGSENFALWSYEADDLILEAIDVFARRLIDHARAAVDAGIRGVFAWVGPELCIPPLMSPAHFDRYVAAFDKPLIDTIHEAGGHAWVHCHGRMGPVLEKFVDMGVDVLNPIEPPPMGDITLAEAFRRVNDRMGLEGNLETHDFMSGTTELLAPKIHEALRLGNGHRFILCPSSGYAENAEPSGQEIDNWLFYIRESVRAADALSG